MCSLTNHNKILLCRKTMACLEDKPGIRKLIIILLLIGLLLTVILVPLTFSYVEYYEYGLVQRKTTGSVYTDVVYARGRYNLGPDYKFLKYQADAHVENLNEVSVFSAGQTNSSIGLEFKIDVFFTFLLKQDEVGLLHEDFALSYRDNVVSRTKEAIKNAAIFVTFEEYFQNRDQVELRFRKAVQDSWNAQPPLHCSLDQFHLGRIQIPEQVAEKQLESRIQNERNDRESYLQKAQIERETTAVAVNTINLEQEKVRRTAQAEADLIVAKAKVEAGLILQDAQNNGTLMLVDATGIRTQEQKTAFSYLWALMNRDELTIGLDYITDENVVKTRGV